jgi:hypothetical protein
MQGQLTALGARGVWNRAIRKLDGGAASRKMGAATACATLFDAKIAPLLERDTEERLKAPKGKDSGTSTKHSVTPGHEAKREDDPAREVYGLLAPNMRAAPQMGVASVRIAATKKRTMNMTHPKQA